MTYDELAALGWGWLGDHGRFHTLRLGRLTLDTTSHTLLIKGEGHLVSTKVKQYPSEEDACRAALVLEGLL